MCGGGVASAVQSVRVRHIPQLGRLNEDGQVDTRFLSPCQGRRGGEAAGDYADFCLPSPR